MIFSKSNRNKVKQLLNKKKALSKLTFEEMSLLVGKSKNYFYTMISESSFRIQGDITPELTTWIVNEIAKIPNSRDDIKSKQTKEATVIIKKSEDNHAVKPKYSESEKIIIEAAMIILRKS